MSLEQTAVLRSQTRRAAAACTKLIELSAKGLCCPLVGEHYPMYSMLPSADMLLCVLQLPASLLRRDLMVQVYR